MNASSDSKKIELSVERLKYRRTMNAVWALRGMGIAGIATFFLANPAHDQFDVWSAGALCLGMLMVGWGLGQWVFLGGLLMEQRLKSITLARREDSEPVDEEDDEFMAPSEMYRGLQSFGSIQEAEALGWVFDTPLGRYQDQIFFKYAQCDDQRFEYAGLRLRMTEKLQEHERAFGVFVYRRSVNSSNPSILNPS